jgi:hypothetical protein
LLNARHCVKDLPYLAYDDLPAGQLACGRGFKLLRYVKVLPPYAPPPVCAAHEQAMAHFLGSTIAWQVLCGSLVVAAPSVILEDATFYYVAVPRTAGPSLAALQGKVQGTAFIRAMTHALSALVEANQSVRGWGRLGARVPSLTGLAHACPRRPAAAARPRAGALFPPPTGTTRLTHPPPPPLLMYCCRG